MRSLVSIFLFLLITFTGVNNAFSTSPDVFVQSTVNRASLILSKDFSKEEKMNQLKIIAKETVILEGLDYTH